MSRPIDDVSTDVLELQAHVAAMRDDLAMLWRHAIVVTVAVLLIGAWIWLTGSPQ